MNERQGACVQQGQVLTPVDLFELRKEQLPLFIKNAIMEATKKGEFQIELRKGVAKQVGNTLIEQGYLVGEFKQYSYCSGKAEIRNFVSWRNIKDAYPCIVWSGVPVKNVKKLIIPSASEARVLSVVEIFSRILDANNRGETSLNILNLGLGRSFAKFFEKKGYKVAFSDNKDVNDYVAKNVGHASKWRDPAMFIKKISWGKREEIPLTSWLESD